MNVNVEFGERNNRNSRRKKSRNYGRSRRSKRVTTPRGKMGFGLLFLAVAVFAFFLVGISANKTKDYVETYGYVVDYREDYDYRDDTSTWAEIVQYTVDGKIYRYYSSSYSTYPKFKGSKVTIYYNPDDPRECTTDGPASRTIAFIICGIFAVAGAFVAGTGVKDLVAGYKNDWKMCKR